MVKSLGKRDKMRGLSSFLSLFHNEFDKFNNTGARMLDSIYHMTLNLLLLHFCSENVNILPSFMQSYYGHHKVTVIILLICKP